MIKRTIVLLGVFCVLAVSSLAWADGLFAGPFLDWFGGSGNSGQGSCAPACGPRLDFYVGWQGGHRHVVSASTNSRQTPGALFTSVTLDAPSKGVWLGASTGIDINCKVALLLQGWYLLPSDSQGSMYLDPGGSITNQATGNFGPKSDWWYVDGMGAFCVNGPFSVVQGWRFDHHTMTTRDSSIPVLNSQINPFRFDVDVLSTIPYIGVQWSNPTTLTVRAIFAPFGWLNASTTIAQSGPSPRPPTEIKGGGNFQRIQFFEFFGEYSKPVSSNLKMGVFGRITSLHAATTGVSLSETLNNGAASYDASVNTFGWTIGGKASMTFSSPGFF